MSRVKSKTAAFLLAASILMAGSSYAATSCCVGKVGDANHSGEEEPTIGDVSALIVALFIQGIPDPITDWSCPDECGRLQEADIDQSGGCCPTFDDITISDIAPPIGRLFIQGPYDPILNPWGIELPDCLICE